MGFFEIFSAGLAGLYGVVSSYGLAIILLTLVTRVILLPLSIKQTRSMREMAVIQPEIKKIQAKYKGNRQKMNEEMMGLYKEHGVNPFGGCLPLLMQFPILIGLFYVIRTPLAYLGYRKEEVGGIVEWIPRNLGGFMETLQGSSLASELTDHALRVNQFLSLRLDCYPSQVLSSQPSNAVNVDCGSGIASFIPYAALILFMGFTTYYQQKQMQARNADSPQAQQMQMIGRIMPLMLMVFAYNFPTGVVLYWVTTNLWTIVQQRIILAAAPLPTPGANGKAKAKPAAGGGALKAGSGPQTKSKPAPDGSRDKPKQQAPTGASKPHPSSKKKKKRR